MLMIFKKNKRLLKDNFNAINGININLIVSIYIQRKKVFPLRDVGNILFASSVLYSYRRKMFNSSYASLGYRSRRLRQLKAASTPLIDGRTSGAPNDC